MIAKLLLMSLLFFSVILPARAARDKSRARALKKLLRWMCIFCVLYLLSAIYVYPRLDSG